jgi:hypothetical protein
LAYSATNSGGRSSAGLLLLALGIGLVAGTVFFAPACGNWRSARLALAQC